MFVSAIDSTRCVVEVVVSVDARVPRLGTNITFNVSCVTIDELGKCKSAH